MTTPDEVPPSVPDFAVNRPHHRRFGDPSARPSNERQMLAFDDYVRARITECVTGMDALDVVREAESLLATSGRLRRGDPGE